MTTDRKIGFLSVVAGMFALACMVVSGCGGYAKPSTPVEKRFAESVRAGMQSVCDMEKTPKEYASELMREVLSETNAVKRQRLLSFICDAMANTHYVGGANYDVRLHSRSRLRSFRDMFSDALCGQKEFGVALELWFAEGVCLQREAEFCMAEEKRYDEAERGNGGARVDFATGCVGNQWRAHARYCLDYHKQDMAAYVLWDDSIAARYCEGKSDWKKWRVARRIKKVIGRYPDWYLESKQKRTP